VLGVAFQLVAQEGREVARDVDDLFRAQRAGEDPDQREAPDIGVAAGADDLGDQRAGRVARDVWEVVTGRCGHGRVRVGDRRRESRLDDLIELFHADAGARADRQDGEEVGLGDRGLDVGDQLRGVEVLAGEVAVQQRVVFGLLDDRLDEAAAIGLDLVELVGRGLAAGAGAVGGVLRDEGQRSDDGLVLGVDRQVDRLGVAEDPAAGGDGLVEVRPRHVELAHGDDARHTDRGTLLPQQGGRPVDAVGTGDDENGGVGGAQPRAQLTDEVGVSRGVDEVDRQAGTLDSGDLDAHRALVLALVGTTAGRAGSDEVVEEGGFARTAGSDEHDIANLLGTARHWCGRVISVGGCFAHGLHLSPRQDGPQGDVGPIGHEPTARVCRVATPGSRGALQGT
jgi:hypothetical protein